MLAPGHLHPVLAITAMLCIAVGAGACGAINMWYDRDIDAVMKRTRQSSDSGGTHAAGISAGVRHGARVGLRPDDGFGDQHARGRRAGGSIAFYVFIYTVWLKRRTPQNIVIGGAAGAFPAVIGWAAVTGISTLVPLVMFAIVFFWTPPHFWSLALFANADYERAGVPMLPVVSGARHTRRHILAYTVILVALSVVPWVIGFSGRLYVSAAAVLGLGFLVHAWRVLREAQDATGVSLAGDAAAKATFRFSISYLFLLFGALAIDRLIQ